MKTDEKLRSILKNSIDTNKWHSILKNYFNIKNLRKEGPEKMDRMDGVNQGYYHGYIDDGAYRIGLFSYDVQQGDVSRKKIGLRNLVKQYINVRYGNFDAAWVVFYGEKEWRMSFICDIKDVKTDPKRYTYVFGNETALYRTPMDRLLQLKDAKYSFDAFQSAFSVEALSDAFFEGYREKYADFVQSITGKRYVKEGNKYVEKNVGRSNKTLFDLFESDGKRVRDYVKKMMGRLTFLHFLQHKGWMNGDLNYLQGLFNRKSTQYRGRYLSDVLEPLFFGVLNTKESDREKVFQDNRWDLDLLEEWKTIPYLNGGLFEADKEDEIECDFKDTQFRELFDFFSQYNFTIDENDPNDAEVGVDPEMLGKIFENLLEDNKDKGAFYTPKEIVQYMCQESLMAYLNNSTSIAQEKIKKFVQTPEDGINDIPENKRDKLNEALKNVKICDPAIGSGAFPMGLLNLLLRCREAIEQGRVGVSELKKEIIKNNIYGVDIEKGAVDIARLRFWLSIVVDEDKPTPLPNLDYKIMQGNSLIEGFMGIDLSKLTYKKTSKHDNGELELFDNDKITIQKFILNELQKYYSCNDHIFKQKIQDEITKSVYLLLESQGNTQSIIEDLKNYKIAGNNQFFLWHTWFNDVFEKGGFNIVIGNPPYIGEKYHKDIFLNVKNNYPLKNFYLGKMDYFYFFFHEALNLLKDKGVCSFITTNYYPTALGARILRDDLKKRSSLTVLFNLGELKLFKNAPGQHNMITTFIKGSVHNNQCNIIDVHKKGELTKKIFIEIINKLDSDTYYSNVDQSKLYEGEDNYIRIQHSEGHDEDVSIILEKFKKNTKTLGEIAEVNAGIMGGCDNITASNIKDADSKVRELLQIHDGVFVLNSDNERDDYTIQLLKNTPIYKDFYKNSDIDRYITSVSTSKHIIFSSKSASKKDQDLIQHCLSKYESILKNIRAKNNENLDLWYMLRRGTAHPHIFEAPKIVCPQRSKRNTFGYNECSWYASADVYYITNSNKEYPLKYLLGLLNSKICYIWLYFKGKKKGSALELYQKPLSEMPIKKATDKQVSNIVELVDQIIKLKTYDSDNDITIYENKVNNIIYDIYNYNAQEIELIEKLWKSILYK